MTVRSSHSSSPRWPRSGGQAQSLFSSALDFFLRVTAGDVPERQIDPPLLVNFPHPNRHDVPYVHYISNFFYVPRRKFGYMDKSFLARPNFNKGAEVKNSRHFPLQKLPRP